MLVIAHIDPFSLFQTPITFRKSLKDSVAEDVDNALYKFVKFRNEGLANIILGDSRMYTLDSNVLKSVAGQPYFNFSIRGAAFDEIADAFWFAADRIELKSVYFGLNFLLYNESFRRDRTGWAKAIIDNPLLYFCDYNVLKPSAYMVATLGKSATNHGRPKMTKEQFWHYVLYTETVPGYVRKYRYPESYHQKLVKIAEYCRAKGIRLHFVIPPTHTDLQKRMGDFHLRTEEARFKRQLAELAPTYDFEIANELTADTANFKDPMHYSAKVGELLIHEIWGDSLHYGRLLQPDSVTQ